MQIEKDSRQVPKKEEVIKNKNYLDLLWGYLQINSEWESKDPNHRFLIKRKHSQTLIGEALGISRQTIKKKLDYLIEIGILTDAGDIWILNKIPDHDAFLIPNETLRKLVSFTNERVISIYTYILNRYIAVDKTGFILSITGLKSKLGLSTTTCSNNYIITDILECLQRIKLIDYHIETVRKDGGQLVKQYVITSATNVLPEC